MIEVNLIGDGLPVLVDDMSAQLGGSFYGTPLRPYSPAPMQWVWEKLRAQPKADLIDVGASTGCYSLLAKHHPNMRVHAFEPVERTAKVLRENVRLNKLGRRVHIYNAAAGNYDGEGVCHAVKWLGGSGLSIVNGKPAWHKDCEDYRIPVMTIDALCKARRIRPTVIKIDTEGAEKWVLEGAVKTIYKHKPYLVIEYSPENIDQFGYAPTDITDLLSALGYEWINPENTDLWCTPKG